MPVVNATDLEELWLPERELIELDANELETIFTDHNHSFTIYGENVDDGPEYQEVQELPNGLELSDLPTKKVVADTTKPPSHQNLMLVSIPSSLQSANVFNLLPNLPLEPDVVNKITAASIGHDGVFLRRASTVPRTPLITRCPPFQIIQQLPSLIDQKQTNLNIAAVACKRKQRFNLTREDGIAFYDELPKASASVKSVLNTSNDSSFKWLSSEDDAVEVTKPVVDEANRCPNCQKVFKKLINHKCRKIPKPAADTKSRCPTCSKVFIKLVNHKCKNVLKSESVAKPRNTKKKNSRL